MFHENTMKFSMQKFQNDSLWFLCFGSIMVKWFINTIMPWKQCNCLGKYGMKEKRTDLKYFDFKKRLRKVVFVCRKGN